jgi:uncharacterized integral membrane protein
VETRGQTHVESPAGRAARRIALALTLLFVLAAVSVSSGLVAYTAWRSDLANGLFAILFAVLSAKAALSWMLWRSDPEHHEPGK